MQEFLISVLMLLSGIFMVVMDRRMERKKKEQREIADWAYREMDRISRERRRNAQGQDTEVS